MCHSSLRVELCKIFGGVCGTYTRAIIAPTLLRIIGSTHNHSVKIGRHGHRYMVSVSANFYCLVINISGIGPGGRAKGDISTMVKMIYEYARLTSYTCTVKPIIWESLTDTMLHMIHVLLFVIH